ncbi:MAG: Crp/Fnr family transcriptional regulator [Acidobacteria bacterium]|nr:MAG: Crp/Fnr family transcriptional regulator [Acidobacteriota bacterium]
MKRARRSSVVYRPSSIFEGESELLNWICQPGSATVQAWRARGDWSPSSVYPPGRELFRQGDWPSTVYLIEEGLIKLTHLAAEGHPVIVGLYARGSLLGSTAALLQQALLTTAETVTPCRIAHLRAAEFRRLVQTDPQFSLSLHLWNGQGWRAAVQQLSLLRSLPAERRFMTFIEEFWSISRTPRSATPVRLPMPLKCWELAQLIAVTPEYLSRLVARLERYGLLRREGRCFTILDPRALERGWSGMATVRRSSTSPDR